ncbi:hypothetical protein [Flavobacterium beibuense]|uniref:hypothetical protein n=1 Tax=Flavobacterium beibuense TaxID=657326 RepID=UPI003A925C25
MPKTKTIWELLGYSPDEYTDVYLSRYMRWLLQKTRINDHGTTDFEDLQKLMANTAVNRFFNDRFNDLEHQAYKVVVHNHDKLPVSTLRRLYEQIMVEIYQTFPKPLFDEARKLKIDNNLN